MESSEITWRKVRKFEEEYSFVRLLGAGTFGTCFLVRSNANRKLCVLKALHESLNDDLCQEVDILMNISTLHTNILTYMDHFAVRSLPEKMALLCKERCTHCIVTEYVEGDTLLGLGRKLHSRKETLEPAFLRSVLLSSLDGLCFLHEQVRIAHRDVKPGNILVTPDGRAVLIDFGLSVVLHRKRAPQDDSGTPNYFSPNLIMLSRQQERATHLMWFASDIWALGASLFFLCTGREVAKLHSDRERTFDEVLAFECPAIVYGESPDLNAVLLDMLIPDQHERPKASELLERVTQMRLLRRRSKRADGGGSCSSSSGGGVLQTRSSNCQPDEPVAKRTRHVASAVSL